MTEICAGVRLRVRRFQNTRTHDRRGRPRRCSVGGQGSSTGRTT
jgi:hypothetical protein